MSNTTSEIKDGIEFYEFTRHDGVVENETACARCGSSAYWDDCEWCGGEGEIERDAHWGDYLADDPDYGTCPSCRGTGGAWHCLSSRAWCEAHPLIGRDHIASTAYTASGVEQC